MVHLKILQALEKLKFTEQSKFDSIDLYIDDDCIEAHKYNLVPVASSNGQVGALTLSADFKDVLYLLLNRKQVKYALDEGFSLDEIYECFKDTLFYEIDEKDFYDIIFKTVDL